MASTRAPDSVDSDPAEVKVPAASADGSSKTSPTASSTSPTTFEASRAAFLTHEPSATHRHAPSLTKEEMDRIAATRYAGHGIFLLTIYVLHCVGRSGAVVSSRRSKGGGAVEEGGAGEKTVGLARAARASRYGGVLLMVARAHRRSLYHCLNDYVVPGVCGDGPARGRAPTVVRAEVAVCVCVHFTCVRKIK